MAKKNFKSSYKRKRQSLKNSPFANIKLEKKFLGGLIQFKEVVF